MQNGSGDYGSHTEFPEYGVAIGHPTRPVYQSQNVYFRDYSNGVVIVNPSATNSFTVNVGATYTDLGGKAVGPTILLAPTTAVVLHDAVVSPPTNLRAGPATSSSVTMTWDVVAGASFYQVAYRTASASSYTVVNTGTQNGYTVGNLTPNTTVYAYAQTCTSSAGCSNWAGYITLTSSSASQPPLSPVNLRAGTATASTVQVLWDPSTGGTDYQVAYREASQQSYTVVDVGNQSSYTIANLPANVTVYAYVEACNASGCSAWAGYLSLQTAAVSGPPPPPGNLRQGARTTTTTQILWDAAAGASTYQVAYRQSTQSSYTIADTGGQSSYAIAGLSGATTVYAYVRACNSSGCSDWAGYATLSTS
jgi:hypothetical protein